MKRVLAGAVLVVVAIVGVSFAVVRNRTREEPPPPERDEIATSPLLVTVTFAGDPPREREIDVSADPFCAAAKARPSRAIHARDGRLANVLVRVVGAPATRAPADAAVLDQRGCFYAPRVLGVVKGQPLVVKSSDATGHNVHTWDGETTCFNRAQPNPSSFTPASLCVDEGVLAFKCDIHPWMTAFVHVLPNRFFAVTGSDGVARLDAPRGTWTVEAWHETLGRRTAEVTIGDGPAEARFDLR